MNQHRPSILMPLHSGQRTVLSTEQVASAACFANWLGADLHILIAPAPDTNALMRFEEKLLKLTPRDCSFSIETDAKPMSQAILATSARRKPEMVILMARASWPQLLRRGITLAEWQRRVLTESTEPVLVLSASSRLAPFQSIVVPLKGEPGKADAALSYSIQLGIRARIPLDILHVSPKQEGGDTSAVGQLSDEYYHEYPRRVEEMIAEASPLSSVRDRTIIRDFLHVRGDMDSEVFRSLKKHKNGLLVIEWDGNFAQARPEMIQSIFFASRCPVLVVKPAPAQHSTLTLGGVTIAA